MRARFARQTWSVALAFALVAVWPTAAVAEETAPEPCPDPYVAVWFDTNPPSVGADVFLGCLD